MDAPVMEQMDYGNHLYSSKLFRTLFPDFEPRQRQAARDLWTRVLSRCGVDPGMPVIDCIVDLGCGEGTLTEALFKEALKVTNERGMQRPLRMFGVDSSAAAIKLAGVKSRPGLKFIRCDDDFAALFDQLGTVPYDICWERTALVCLSHTWFHLNQVRLCEAVRRCRPALLMIDVFHSWDEVLDKLAPGENAVLEDGRPVEDDECTYWLRTCLAEEGSRSRVLRGLWKNSVGDRPNEGVWAVPPTVQEARTSEELFGVTLLPEEEDIFQKSRQQGAITGEIISKEGCETGCDYITRKAFRHGSGWGDMRCYVLVSRDAKEALPVNLAYFEVVRDIVRRLFVEEAAGNERGSNLHNLLTLFDEDAAWTDQTKFAGSREALVVLPFDPHTNFARIVGLFGNSPDAEISRHDLIVEVPKDKQVRFPTAFGIYHTMEDRVSSPQAFPLEWAVDYKHEPIDEAFARLENKLLGLRRADGTAIAFHDKRDPSYFLLPVYFGSLPLFALALRFPALFNPGSTDYQVYFSALTNLHSEIKISLTDEFVRGEILNPWMVASTLALGAQASLNQVVERLEVMLFGVPVPDEPANPAANFFRLGNHRRVGGVLGKDWKSWVLGIPSYPIKRLRSTEAENTRLWVIWQQERERLLLNDELRLSRWFEQGNFFVDHDGSGHDRWDCREHLRRLHGMFALAGIDTAALAGAHPDDDWAQEGIETLQGLYKSNRKQPGTAYFMRSTDHFLFNWMAAELGELFLARNACEAAVRGCELVGGKLCAREEAYQNLKAVFCKTLENKGEAVRFGLRRLECLVRAAGGRYVDVVREQRELPQGLASPFWSEADPSMPLAEFVYALQNFCRGRACDDRKILARIGCREIDANACVVSIKISSGCMFAEKAGGVDCERVRSSYEKVRATACALRAEGRNAPPARSALAQAGIAKYARGDGFASGEFEFEFWVRKTNVAGIEDIEFQSGETPA